MDLLLNQQPMVSPFSNKIYVIFNYLPITMVLNNLKLQSITTLVNKL